MEKNIYNGNVLIRRLVIIADFFILNCLLLGLVHIDFLHVPAYLDLKTKITFFIANVALAIGEYNYSTIIHIRRIGFQQVLKRTLLLVLCSTICSLAFRKSAGEISRCFLKAVAKFDEEYPYSSPISVILFSFSTFRRQALLSRRTLLIN